MRVKTPSVFLPDDGEHEAVLTGVEDLGEQDSRYGKRPTCKLIFNLDDTGMEQWWYMKPTLHSASNFYKVAAALLNAVPPKEIETKDLIGRRCILVTEQYTNQNNQQRSGVKEIKPIGRPAYTSPPAYSAPPSPPPSPRPSQITPSDPISDDDVPF